MPWQTPDYYTTQKRTLRPGTYLRLHENRWATSSEIFLTPELWDSCVETDRTPMLVSDAPIFIGVDAGIKHDTAAVVAVKWDKHTDKLVLVSHRIWKPTPTEPLDLEGTIEWYLRELYNRNRVEEIIVDPW